MTNWPTTTHDWSTAVDAGHLREIQGDPERFAPSGVLHLVLEVIAYAADEAESRGVTGRCVLTGHGDGSVSVADDGRGTDTRYDDQGRPVKKPVMSTQDVRFFGHPGAQTLPDGHPRRGMSVVAALSEWLVHTNRRAEAAWSQRYERGVPVTDLVPVPEPDGTGTTVRFRPGLPGAPVADLDDLIRLAADAWPHLTFEVERA